jgi:phage-related protein
LKSAIFHRAVREAIRAWPADVTRAVGKAIWELQKGAALGMPLSRPMRSVAPGVHELRIKDSSGAYRVFYFAKSLRGVLIFHAFVKKSQKTPLAELLTGRRRLQEVLDEETN